MDLGLSRSFALCPWERRFTQISLLDPGNICGYPATDNERYCSNASVFAPNRLQHCMLPGKLRSFKNATI